MHQDTLVNGTFVNIISLQMKKTTLLPYNIIIDNYKLNEHQ